jgi:hypothetical protein
MISSHLGHIMLCVDSSGLICILGHGLSASGFDISLMTFGIRVLQSGSDLMFVFEDILKWPYPDILRFRDRLCRQARQEFQKKSRVDGKAVMFSD